MSKELKSMSIAEPSRTSGAAGRCDVCVRPLLCRRPNCPLHSHPSLSLHKYMDSKEDRLIYENTDEGQSPEEKS